MIDVAVANIPLVRVYDRDKAGRVYTVRDVEEQLQDELLVTVSIFNGRDRTVAAFEDQVVEAFRQASDSSEDLATACAQSLAVKTALARWDTCAPGAVTPGLPPLQFRWPWLICGVCGFLALIYIQILLLAGPGLVISLVLLPVYLIGLRVASWRIPPFHDRIDHLVMQMTDRWQRYRANDQEIRWRVRMAIREVAVLFREVDPSEMLMAQCGLRPGFRCHQAIAVHPGRPPRPERIRAAQGA